MADELREVDALTPQERAVVNDLIDLTAADSLIWSKDDHRRVTARVGNETFMLACYTANVVLTVHPCDGQPYAIGSGGLMPRQPRPGDEPLRELWDAAFASATESHQRKLEKLQQVLKQMRDERGLQRP